ncbi:amidohydrolase family protein [Burkholderia glumae]|uniref:Amidohydrolase family protein n=1 Tax=Burkholderia glumae TaxID=337 RepID=A0AAP9XWS9_BURGL|nr:amidohydrolase family protein [Burkholderia glumae]ACR32177.1 Amidohydrolase 2 [Burkholderia glumae BGR1]AJY64264.1 amidohydrolase family protein [Burkholderia glumae LMG 2196 = ATCC 33617]KHJ63884.1 amidohydrolase [Burkholderia glumae]MCM2484639.1 amidohydrolase family protein [Burkholderia glumae]MCM2495020.1 amidohydrolase family protein [Burkholderia glumae]
MMPRVDAHQHYWRIAARGGYWPPGELRAIFRDFTPPDLAPELEAAGIDGTVLVQSLPTEADTQYLLELAAGTDSVWAVVGWVDLKGADAASRIASFAAHPKARGLRPMLQDLADDAWIDDPALEPAVAAMLAHRLCFDALVLPRHLDALLAFAQRFPDLPIVIDHGAKPAIARGESEPWRARMTRLASLPNVHCKLSGLWTEAGAAADRDALDTRSWPYVQALAELFGPRRLMWGSDWPVLRLADGCNGYADWLAACEEQGRRAFGPDAAGDLFGGNACRFYGIGPSGRSTRSQ